MPRREIASAWREELRDRRPGRLRAALRHELSGGQQQRVALARAVVMEPQAAAVRRAAVEPRRRAARAHALRADRIAAPARPHLGLRHPRPGRGDGDERPHHRDAGRPHRPGGRAARTSTSARRAASSPTSSATAISSKRKSPASRTIACTLPLPSARSFVPERMPRRVCACSSPSGRNGLCSIMGRADAPTPSLSRFGSAIFLAMPGVCARGRRRHVARARDRGADPQSRRADSCFRGAGKLQADPRERRGMSCRDGRIVIAGLDPAGHPVNPHR